MDSTICVHVSCGSAHLRGGLLAWSRVGYRLVGDGVLCRLCMLRLILFAFAYLLG